MNRTHPLPRRLALLHADTPDKCDRNDLPLASAALALRLSSLPYPDGFRVLAAIWSREGRSDEECRRDFFRTALSFKRKCEAAGIPPDRVPLSVEDLRLIGNDLAALDALATVGVISVAPFWRGENALGGAWDTGNGLTEFGRRAIERSLSLGLIPDVSHASREAADGILTLCERAEKPAIASHVGFFSLCQHGRNIADRTAERIARLGGLIGITFHAPHLTGRPRAELGDAVAHLIYGFRKFPDAIALGSDFDGTDELPAGLSSSDDLPALAAALSGAGLSEGAIDAIFYRNADRFFSRSEKQYDFSQTKGS